MRDWHRVFGVSLADVVTGLPFEVVQELELSRPKQRLDVAIIRLTETLEEGLESEKVSGTVLRPGPGHDRPNQRMDHSGRWGPGLWLTDDRPRGHPGRSDSNFWSVTC